MAMRAPRDLRQTATRAVGSAIGRAFTLLELVVVLVILAVISAVALPRVAASMTIHRAYAAAQRVRADLLDARSAAIALSAPMGVSFSTPADAYTITRIDRSAPPRASVDLGAEPYLADITVASFRAAQTNDPPQPGFYFDIWGRPRDPGLVSYDTTGAIEFPLMEGVVRIESGDRAVLVKLDAATGNITIGEMQ